jgi:exopolysaccharide biosynthesis polyprenyl glycosylphosphotransferase
MTIRQADRVLFSWLLDSIIVALSLFGASALRDVLPLGPEFRPASEVPLWLYIAALAIWGVLSFSFGVHSPGIVIRRTETFRLIGVHLLGVLVLATLIYLTQRNFSRYLFLYFAAVSLGAMLAWRLLAARLLSSKPQPPARVVIVGTGPEAAAVYQRIYTHYDSPVTVVGFIAEGGEPVAFELPAGARLLGDLTQLARLRDEEKFDEAIIALPSASRPRLAQIVGTANQLQVRVYLYFEVLGLVLLYGHSPEGSWRLIGLPSSVIGTREWLVKRLLDLLVASVLVAIMLPVMAVIALAIKLDSPGSIVFRQRRIGENGRPFTLFKFRSMVEGAEDQQDLVNTLTPSGELIHKHPDDPRVTRTGRFLRRWSLDELPGLWNVLRGEMSLVGPRPEMPWVVERYKPDNYQRFLVPPGLTGFWQVGARSTIPMHLAVSDDLYYIENYSLWLDLWILLKTPLAVIRGHGAF